MRYVIQTGENQFAKWIGWRAAVHPHVTSSTDFDKAMIVDDDYLNVQVRNGKETRKEKIQQNYPEIRFVKVKVEIIKDAEGSNPQ